MSCRTAWSSREVDAKARALRLSDGRTLAYDDHVPASGTPLLYFHGAPSAGSVSVPAAVRLILQVVILGSAAIGLYVTDSQRHERRSRLRRRDLTRRLRTIT
jgi:hypothetical protein